MGVNLLVADLLERLLVKGRFLHEEIARELDDLRGYPSITLSAKTSWLKTNPEIARRFLRALARADRMIQAEPARAQALLRKRFEITSFRLIEPTIALETDSSGKGNWEFPSLSTAATLARSWPRAR